MRVANYLTYGEIRDLYLRSSYCLGKDGTPLRELAKDAKVSHVTLANLFKTNKANLERDTDTKFKERVRGLARSDDQMDKDERKQVARLLCRIFRRGGYTKLDTLLDEITPKVKETLEHLLELEAWQLENGLSQRKDTYQPILPTPENVQEAEAQVKDLSAFAMTESAEEDDE